MDGCVCALTRQWQIMKEAETFLRQAARANEALIGIRFVQTAKSRHGAVDVQWLNRVSNGIELLRDVVGNIEARQSGKRLDSDTLSIVYAISQKRLVSDTSRLKDLLQSALDELQGFRDGRDVPVEQAIEILEMIATSTAEEAERASSKMHVFASEAL
jgi:hypothetical protein